MLIGCFDVKQSAGFLFFYVSLIWTELAVKEAKTAVLTENYTWTNTHGDCIYFDLMNQTVTQV